MVVGVRVANRAVTRQPSPNFSPRRGGHTPQLVVLHFTAMESCRAALERLCAPAHEVSSHYLIGRDGGLFQLVDEEMRAWHAGAGAWGGQSDVNSRSIGIELDNTGAHPFSAPQMDRLTDLLAGILERWNILPKGVIGHSDLAPMRKSDPGPRFDWHRLARAGLSVWPEPVSDAAPDDATFLDHAARFGYPTDHGLAPILTAFRLRFRPWATGPLASADMAAIADLAARHPA